MQVERSLPHEAFGLIEVKLSGGRVSNAWETYPMQGDNLGKLRLIPHNA